MKRYSGNCTNCGAPFTASGPQQRNCSRECGQITKSQTAKKKFAARFAKFVDKSGPVISTELGHCWEWTGGRFAGGYGKFWHSPEPKKPRALAAHRAAWFVAHGEWPDRWVLHSCDNRACVNPSHLRLGDRQENVDEMIKKGRHYRGPNWRRHVADVRSRREKPGLDPWATDRRNRHGARIYSKPCAVCGEGFDTTRAAQPTCGESVCRRALMRERALDPGRIAARFWPKVNKIGDVQPHRRDLDRCWEWIGAKERSGHGRLAVNLGNRKHHVAGAHRVSFFLHHARWPEPCCLHRCDNPSCVNPAHLFEGTKADNVADMFSKGRNPPRHGVHAPRAKITEEQARWVIDQLAVCRRQVDVAAELGVSFCLVNAISLGKSWQHLSRPVGMHQPRRTRTEVAA